MATWQRQREQILEWVGARVSELQTIPEGLGNLTARLISSELFTVSSAGALELGTWPEVAGVWTARRAAEKEKFGEVTAWAQTLLDLVAPTPAGASLGSTAGGAGASGSGGVTTSAGANANAGSAAGGGPGGGVSAGRGCVDTCDSDFFCGGDGWGRGAPERWCRSCGGGAVAKCDPRFGGDGWGLGHLALRAGVYGSRARGGEASPTADALAVHPFGKAPMRSLEAHAFEPLVYMLPELRSEECELDELPAGREATVEHWRAFVHLLQARVGEFQRFVKSQAPSFVLSDVMVDSFSSKSESGTVNEEQLARALRGELAPEDVTRPPGAGPSLTAVPSRGPLAGIDLVVSPVQRLQQEDEGRLKLKDGELTVVAKKKKCKDFDEWERGFLRILCEAPAEARDDLTDFMAWARTIAAEFSFYHFNEFYEHLVRQVQRSAVGISLDGYDRVWRVYRQQHNLQEKGVKSKKPRDRYSWRRDAEEQPRPAASEDAGGGRGRGKGAGGRGSGGRGRGGVPDACYGHNEGNCTHMPNCRFRHVCNACGADGHVREGVPVVTPVPMVEAEVALELGEPVVVETVGAEDAQGGCGPPVVEDGGDVLLVLPGGANGSHNWWRELRADEFIPVWDVLGGARRHNRAPMVWEIERRTPLPITQLSPATWASPTEPWRTRVSARWPELRAEILRRATIEGMEACGTGEEERRCYEEECERVGCTVSTLTRHAHLVAAAFRDWHDVEFLVRCAACGAVWPSEDITIDEPYRVPNYVGPEHMDVMREELRRESEAGHIFLAGWRLPLGVIALGLVEKVRKGRVKYRPVSDYSRPTDVGVNARIELKHNEFTTVKEA
ncbi:hypothetical protein CYMTET_46924 [Cymbomonas tetramitiformis]|uniref:C3H1-type domain-containing protein n=1 Tax=Cymbomonas tetramitiformis TaxID=36881 RepID=A0AAE0BV83_9CHLO|nr:hypothetical protein CYMTET_46924 [Cymbomonas tetramitiformis]